MALAGRVGCPSDERQEVGSDVLDAAVVRGTSMDPPWCEQLKFPCGGIAAVKMFLKVAALDAPPQTGGGCLIPVPFLRGWRCLRGRRRWRQRWRRCRC